MTKLVLLLLALGVVFVAADQQCAANDPSCSAASAPGAAQKEATPSKYSAEAKRMFPTNTEEDEEEDEDGEYDAGDGDGMGGMGAMGGLASLAGSLLGGGGGGGLGQYAGLAAAAAPIAAQLMGGGGDGDGGGLASLAASAASAMAGAGDGDGGGMSSLASLVTPENIQKASSAMSSMMQGGRPNDDAIQQGYASVAPLVAKAAPLLQGMAGDGDGDGDGDDDESKEDNSALKSTLLNGIAKFMGVTVGEGEDVQDALIKKLTDSQTFRKTALSAYRLVVTPTTAKTVPREQNSGTMMNTMMETVMEAVEVPDDVERTAAEIVHEREYSIEEHEVPTNDMFKLRLQRIPHGKQAASATQKTPRPVVLLMHGLFDSAASFVNGDEAQSFGYVLADQGYDVWLGNVRGNHYSDAHSALTKESPKFWSWSWDEIAQNDVPAMVNYIIANTSAPSISYVGHSQGATVGLASFLKNSEVASKINIFAAVNPALSLKNSKSMIIKAFRDITTEEQWVKELGSHEVMPTSSVSKMFAAGCVTMPQVCKKVIALITGGSVDSIDDEVLPTFMAHTPTGTSARNLAHWLQLANSDELKSYVNPDGSGGEVLDLAQNTVPTTVFYGGDDLIIPPATVEEAIGKWGNVVHSAKISNWGHLDFVWGKNVTHLYDIVSVLNGKNGLPAPVVPKIEVAESESGESKSQKKDPEPAVSAAPANAQEDKSPQCKEWADQGECTNNPDYMNQECPVSCKGKTTPVSGGTAAVAGSDCKDFAAAADCKAWSEAGECHANKDYMAAECKASCGLCGEIPQTAPPAAAACKDDSPDCATWAKDGECENNKGYMAGACKASCGLC